MKHNAPIAHYLFPVGIALFLFAALLCICAQPARAEAIAPSIAPAGHAQPPRPRRITVRPRLQLRQLRRTIRYSGGGGPWGLISPACSGVLSPNNVPVFAVYPDPMYPFVEIKPVWEEIFVHVCASNVVSATLDGSVSIYMGRPDDPWNPFDDEPKQRLIFPKRIDDLGRIYGALDIPTQTASLYGFDLEQNAPGGEYSLHVEYPSGAISRTFTYAVNQSPIRIVGIEGEPITETLGMTGTATLYPNQTMTVEFSGFDANEEVVIGIGVLGDNSATPEEVEVIDGWQAQTDEYGKLVEAIELADVLSSGDYGLMVCREKDRIEEVCIDTLYMSISPLRFSLKNNQGDAVGDSTRTENLSYTVRPGDTLSGLARYYSITIHALAQSNQLHVNQWLQVGQQLTIPAVDRQTPCAQRQRLRAGQTVADITDSLGVDTERLAAFNSVADPWAPLANSEICIPNIYSRS